ncbi:replication initiation protein, partial [Clostridium sp. SGI.024]|uniref:replication initiation protein n=1 Tax=Clostridium sp. SGI.024 TaxID=3420551 RepID=UPI003CFF9E7F
YMDKNYLVTKSNSLITASYDLSLQEQKLILSLASMVQPTDEEFKEYKFKIKDFMSLLEIETKTKYTEIPKITKELMKKVFEVREGRDVIQLSWLSSARYKTGEGVVILKFDSSLKPYMLQLKELYTSYRLENILLLKSKYSLRLFELLKCNEFKKIWTIELETFKKLLGVTEKSYSIYQNVKNRIILQAQKELKGKTDIKFEFEEIKTGRKVTSLKFYIHSNKDKTHKTNSASDEIAATVSNYQEEIPMDHEDEIKSIILMMKNHNISGLEARKIYNSACGDLKHIAKIYNYFKNKNADNFVALMIKMVKPGEFIEPKKNTTKTKFNNFNGRDYDYDKLEKKLLGWD